jgi:hypothetical protein
VVHDGGVIQRSIVPVGHWATIVADQCGWERFKLYKRPVGN